jgi:hypothetical protein
VVIAAFATWHEHHAIARAAMASRPRLIAHAAIESYSVLTLLPPPHRAHPSIVHAFITERFTAPFLTLRFQAAAVFYANFYPNRQHSGDEMLYILVTAVNWRGLPESVTSLPSWSCGFGSRRPLSTSVVIR